MAAYMAVFQHDAAITDVQFAHAMGTNTPQCCEVIDADFVNMPVPRVQYR